jgi:hypothetical protein
MDIKKNAFIREWLVFNKVDNSSEGKRHLLKQQSYPSVWIKCYRKNKKCGRDDAIFAYIKLHILTCYASGTYEDKCVWKSKRQGVYELHAEHDWDPIYLDKADFYYSWRCFDSESDSESYSSTDDEEQFDLPISCFEIVIARTPKVPIAVPIPGWSNASSVYNTKPHS